MQIIIDVADDTGAITVATDGQEPMQFESAEQAIDAIKGFLPGMSEQDMWDQEAKVSDKQMTPMGGQMGGM